MIVDAEKLLLAHSEGNSDAPIPYQQVKIWMNSDDIEVLGIVYVLITDQRFYPKISPPLNFEQFFTFLTKYFKRCIMENPDGEWSDSRYTAGWDFVNFFKSWWDDTDIERAKINAAKNWIAEIYKQGDKEVRDCIVTAVLEHLFEDKKMAKFFSNWKKDSVLKHAYEEAIGFAKELQNRE